MTDSTTGRARPLVAVGYGPRCVPVMQLAEAAAGVCDLLWMIDTAVPGMSEMADLLNRFGPVVDLEGMNAEQAFKTLADWEPDGMTTYLDARMVELACVAEDLGLPFHSPATAAALTDKARQRQALADAGLDMPPCHLVRRLPVPTRALGRRGRGRVARRPQTPLGPGQPLHLPGPRPRRARQSARRARPEPPQHGPRGLPTRRSGP